ncbi:transmembrane protein 26-like [Carassius auratus]|uniref:Transmembrane protein 26-like n=1 Tax=Carassius auratus TaxID=7957 RepID=A0A6P6PH20_CARAU|nr:transmembrane protein 26-like [Carassius auratus]
MCRVLNILLALLSRFLFAVHGILTVWRVVEVTGEPSYWLLLMGVTLLGVEMAITIKYTQNAEWKWFSPMVFLYLSTVIPSVWFLELNLLQSNLPINSSTNSDPQFFSQMPLTMGLAELDPENWVEALEQTMLIVLVLGRWLMPKGDMSRDQLSQLLMVYVGLGADILDIFDTFKEPQVKTKQAVIIVGLSLFSWALMQFPLVLTQTSHPRVREEGQSEAAKPGRAGWTVSCCSSEVWSLLLTVGLQDGPFLIYRLYLMIRENVLNQLMIFFTCKNILIVLLEVYRIGVVHLEQSNPAGKTHESCDLSHGHREWTDEEAIESSCQE